MRKRMISTAFALISVCALAACQASNGSGNTAPALEEQEEARMILPRICAPRTVLHWNRSISALI